MIPANEHLESSSVHYYATVPAQHADILYYPISAGYYECKPSFCMQHTSLNGYLLIVMLSGALSFQTRKARGTARSGQTLLHGPEPVLPTDAGCTALLTGSC